MCAWFAQHTGGSPSTQGWVDRAPGGCSLGHGQRAWPAQCPGLASVGCNLTHAPTNQCSPQWKHLQGRYSTI